MSIVNWFRRKGAVKVNDLLMIRREEGLDGRIREIFILFYLLKI